MQKTHLPPQNALQNELKELNFHSTSTEIEQELWQLFTLAASSPLKTKNYFFDDARLTIQKVSSFLKLAETQMLTINQ